MSTTKTAVPVTGTEIKGGTLSVTSIVFMVIAAAAPLTVIGGALPIGIATGNGAGYPTMYAISAVILILFSVGLTTMSRHIPEPGAFYSYVEATFGRRIGMGTAYLALLTYTAIQMAVYGFLGAQLALLFSAVGLPIPWWVCSLAVIAVVGLLGYRNIELSSKALGLVLIGEIAITLLIVAAVIYRGGSDGLGVASFTPEHVFSGSPGVGLMLAMAGFIGFEATTVFRGEAKDPDRTIPRATYIAVGVIGVFYTISGWAIVEAWGADNVVAEAVADPEGMVATTAVNYLGMWSGVVVQVLLLTSLFACVLSFHNVLTRYQHAISIKRGLPRQLRWVHQTYNSPHLSSFVQTATVALITVVAGIIGMDPVVHIFTWLSGLATFCIVLLMLLVSIAVIVYFHKRPELAESRWKKFVAPLLSVIGLGIVAFFLGTNLTDLVGGDSVVALCLAVSAPIVFALGVVFARFVPELDVERIQRRREKNAHLHRSQVAETEEDRIS
ncbi:APC family permease [Corynebacterium pacaense]|uniref:APC family permease n=1 Tax=Corynebacterium pacaense TaxID=1816684 RepID=UPI0009B9C3B0|nr:APC family permease [Corynebacterium pacaense]